MADIDNYYDTILTTGKKGEVVRDAIIDAAKLLKKAANNAYYLEGIPYSDFAISTDYYQMVEDIEKDYGWANSSDFETDSNVTEGGPMSTYFVTAGNIYNLLNDYLRPSLRAILKYDVDPASTYKMKEAIEYYIGQMKDARDRMFEATRARNGKVSSDDTLEKLGEAIRNLENASRVEVSELSVTENHKTHDANINRKPADPHYAYSKVTVNINPKTLTKNIRENDVTYTAADEYASSTDPYEGYSSVTVNIPGGKSANASPSSSSRTTGKDGVIVDDQDMMSSKEITERRSYSASEDGVLGWKNIKVNVELEEIPEGETFEVSFYVDEELVQTVPVLPFERARCTAEFNRTKYVDGHQYVFAGWSPNPNKVICDMECVAGWKPSNGEEGKEITDDWATIVSNSGAPYNIGDWKRLTLSTNEVLIMEKVYEGEDGTVSTWLSKNVYGSMPLYDGWWSSPARAYLNGEFLDLLKNGDGGDLYDFISPVMKRSIGGIPDLYVGVMEIETLDRIWIPSIQEVFGICPEETVNNMMYGTFSGIDPNTGNREYGRPMPYAWTEYYTNYLGDPHYTVTYSQTFGNSTWSIYYPDGPYPNSGGGPYGTNIYPSLADPSKAIKNDITDTSPNVYMLRSNYRLERSYGTTSIGRSNIPAIISRTGVFAEGSRNGSYAVPIGFCL